MKMPSGRSVSANWDAGPLRHHQGDVYSLDSCGTETAFAGGLAAVAVHATTDKGRLSMGVADPARLVVKWYTSISATCRRTF